MGDLLRMGVVEAVEGRRCTVRVGDLVSGPVPWFLRRAGKTVAWTRVSPGEQGLLVCPEGEIAAGVFLPGALSTAFDTATTNDVELTTFEDGGSVLYDPAAHRHEVTVPAEGGDARTVAGESSVSVTAERVRVQAARIELN